MLLSVQNISKHFGGLAALSDISFGIEPGLIFGLIGPNGAGKSTFFALLLGESESTAGTIQCDKNIRIGYLPQESSFLSERTVMAELVEGGHLYSIHRAADGQHLLLSGNKLGKGP